MHATLLLCARTYRYLIATATTSRAARGVNPRFHHVPLATGRPGCVVSTTTTTASAPSFAAALRSIPSTSCTEGGGLERLEDASTLISPSLTCGWVGSARRICTRAGSVGAKSGTFGYGSVDTLLVAQPATMASAAAARAEPMVCRFMVVLLIVKCATIAPPRRATWPLRDPRAARCRDVRLQHRYG